MNSLPGCGRSERCRKFGRNAGPVSRPSTRPGGRIAVIVALYFANLLHYEGGADSAQLFERFKKRRQREMTATLLNLMFIRFPFSTLINSWFARCR